MRPNHSFAWLFCLVGGLTMVAPSRSQSINPLTIRIEFADQQPRLVWTNLPGIVHDVFSTADLTAGNWEKVATIVTDTNSASWLDTREQRRTRFYRLSQMAGGLQPQVTLIHVAAAPPMFMPTLTNAPYSSVRSLLTTLAAFGPLRIPLPLPDIAAFADISIATPEVHFDDANRSISVSGAA